MDPEGGCRRRSSWWYVNLHRGGSNSSGLMATLLSDLPNAQRVLRMSGVIDEQAAWIGGETTLVQTGDIVDR
jgi:cation transport regulator ChaC